MGGGSLSHTSSPAPAIFLALSSSSSAFSSWMKPRAVLMKNAVGFMRANCFAPIMPRVSSVSGQLTDTKSASAISVSSSTFLAPRRAISSAER